MSARYYPDRDQTEVQAIYDAFAAIYWVNGPREMAAVHKARLFYRTNLGNPQPIYMGAVIKSALPEHWAKLLLLCGSNGYELENIIL